MILTLTPNPTIDRVYYLPQLRPNWVHRAEREVATPSGKGVDVSIILHLLDKPTLALGLNAGHMGRVLAGLLDEQGVPHDFVEALGETRTVPVLVDQTSGAEYTITAPSLFASEAHLEKLLQRMDKHGNAAWGIVFAGSLPPGLPTDSYRSLLHQARQLNLVTLLDVSGESLRQGIAGLPHILKINQMELAALEHSFTPIVEALEAEDDLVAQLPEFAAMLHTQLGTLASDAIVISMGKKGALAVTEADSYYAKALTVPVAVTNGAGDAMDSGIMLARWRGESWAEAMRLATAAAGAAVMHDGTSGCDPRNIVKLLPEVEVLCISG